MPLDVAHINFYAFHQCTHVSSSLKTARNDLMNAIVLDTAGNYLCFQSRKSSLNHHHGRPPPRAIRELLKPCGWWWVQLLPGVFYTAPNPPKNCPSPLPVVPGKSSENSLNSQAILMLGERDGARRWQIGDYNLVRAIV